jgi:uncharacterized protein Yka (UPF0111/DUF47 family)
MAESVLKIIVTAVDNFTAKFDKMASRAAEIGKRFEKVGKKVTRAVTVPIVALGAASVKAAADFEKGMGNVATLVDTNVENMERMGDEVLEISENVPVAIDSLTEALFDLRSAGTDAGDAMGRLEKSGMLAVAALGTTKQGADVASSAINAFGLEGENADAVFGQFFVATKFGKTTLAEMSQGFGGVAGIVAENNIRLEEFLATTAALTTTGLKASEAYTQQKAVLAGLTRQTEDTQKVFKALGVKDFPALVKQAGGWQDALEQVVDGLGGVGASSKEIRAALQRLDVKSIKELEKRAGSTAAAYEMLSGELGQNSKVLLKALGSTEALNAVLAITGAQGDTAREALGAMGDEAALLDEAFRKQSQTQAAQWQKTKNIMKAAGIQIGKILAPIVTKLAKALQGVAKWFSGLDENTKEWIVTIAVVAAVVGPVILILGKLVAAIGLIGAAVAVVRTEMILLGAAIKANPIGFAVAAFAAAALLVIEHWEPISEFFEFLWDEVVKIFEAAGRAIDRVLSAISDRLNRLSAEFASFVEDVTGVDVTGEIKGALGFGGGGGRAPEPVAPSIPGIPGAGLAQTIATQQLQSTVRVEFANTPQGTRVRSDDQAVDLSVGFQLEGTQ